VSVTRPAPVMPAAPFEVSTISARSPIWVARGMSCPAAWTMNSALSVR
jgi:hypothetical protein